MIIIFQIIRKSIGHQSRGQGPVQDRRADRLCHVHQPLSSRCGDIQRILFEYHPYCSLKYLFEGLHGHHQLVPWIWIAMAMNVMAFLLFLIPGTRKRLPTLNLGCLLIIVGVWIEKGPGFVIPGFVPDPLGEIYEYVPNLLELMVSFGIWAIGLLVFTLLMKVAIPIRDRGIQPRRSMWNVPLGAKKKTGHGNKVLLGKILYLQKYSTL